MRSTAQILVVRVIGRAVSTVVSRLSAVPEVEELLCSFVSGPISAPKG
jgi:hypothetical protein